MLIYYHRVAIIDPLIIMGSVMAEKAGYSTVNKILILQAWVIFMVTFGFSFLGINLVISSLLGGITAFLPNLYFAYRMSRVKGESAKNIVQSFYRSESRKILMTCVLFVIAFQVPGIQFFPLMACYVLVLSVFWLALILFAQDFEIRKQN